MIKYQEFLSKCNDEIDAMLANDHIDDYLRFTGEKVATIHLELRQAVAERRDRSEIILVLLFLSSYHADALMRLNLYRDAFEFEIATLTLAAEMMDFRKDFSPITLQNYIITVDAFEYMVREMNQQDKYTCVHLAWIGNYIYSLMYFHYNTTGRLLPNDPMLSSAYDRLQDNMDCVVMKNGKVMTIADCVDPTTPIPIFSDLIGRAVAIGLFNQQS